MNERQKRQLAFHEGHENIIVGKTTDLPISITALKEVDKRSELVIGSFESGLTAIVYHLEIDGRHYNLKRKRPESLVKNVDGHTSFLNEVQRRKSFEQLRKNNPILDKGIVKTIYANYREGIMLSEWINGGAIEVFNHEVLDQLFSLTLEMEKHGIMEWDLCKGNILLTEDGVVKLFDFGYAYTYDPRVAFNSEGLVAPLFNNVERFETRFFMPYLLEMELKEPNAVMPLYKMVKQVAIKSFKRKEVWLNDIQATPILLQVCREQICKWEAGIRSEEALNRLYKLESIRSYVLDIHDDLMGKSCTPATILKVDKVLSMIKYDFDFIKANDGFLWDDNRLNKAELISKYEGIREQVMMYQI